MEPITWMKAKYRAEKTKGRYKSTGGSSQTKKKHAKNAKHIKPGFTMLKVIDLDKGGKTRWERIYV